MALSVRGSSPFVLLLASLGTKLTVAFDILTTAVSLIASSKRPDRVAAVCRNLTLTKFLRVPASAA